MASEYNDNVRLNAPKALEDKSGKFVNGVWQPFDDITEAQLAVPDYRHKFMVQVILKNGVPTEYWYRDGIANNNLVQKHLDKRQLTQAEYNALSIKDPNTIYYIVG